MTITERGNGIAKSAEPVNGQDEQRIRAAVDSPARLCWQAIKGRQQGVLPPTVLSERENSMRNRIVKVTEVVVRSAFYIISNYVFVSMGLSFHTQWISILFLLSMVWSTIDYGKSINEIIEKKVIAEILCICCIALSIAMAYFVGYIQGAFVSL